MTCMFGSVSRILRHRWVLGPHLVVILDVPVAFPGVSEPDVGRVDTGEVLDRGRDDTCFFLEPGCVSEVFNKRWRIDNDGRVERRSGHRGRGVLIVNDEDRQLGLPPQPFPLGDVSHLFQLLLDIRLQLSDRVPVSVQMSSRGTRAQARTRVLTLVWEGSSRQGRPGVVHLVHHQDASAEQSAVCEVSPQLSPV